MKSKKEKLSLLSIPLPLNNLIRVYLGLAGPGIMFGCYVHSHSLSWKESSFYMHFYEFVLNEASSTTTNRKMERQHLKFQLDIIVCERYSNKASKMFESL